MAITKKYTQIRPCVPLAGFDSCDIRFSGMNVRIFELVVDIVLSTTFVSGTLVMIFLSGISFQLTLSLQHRLRRSLGFVLWYYINYYSNLQPAPNG